MGSIPVGDSDFSLSHARVMLNISSFTSNYRAQNSPSSFTYHNFVYLLIYFDVMIKDILKLKYVLSGNKTFVANYNKHYLYLQNDLSSFRILIQFVVTDNCEQTAKRNVRLL